MIETVKQTMKVSMPSWCHVVSREEVKEVKEERFNVPSWCHVVARERGNRGMNATTLFRRDRGQFHDHAFVGFRFFGGDGVVFHRPW